MSKEEERLKLRIKELEAELSTRDMDIKVFRDEIAKLNIQLQNFISQLGEELSLAHLIQKVLVPTEIPTIPGFEFSAKFEASAVRGGDYYDIFEMEDKFRFGLLVSSSSGHGMAALFLSVLLNLGSQRNSRRSTSPGLVLEQLAKDLVPNIQGSESISAFYAMVDRKTFEVSYTGAGPMVALFFQHGSDKLNRLNIQTKPVEKGFNSPFTVETISLNPRDRLLVCSPGMFSLKNAIGVPFGEEKLYKIVLGHAHSSCHELRNEILFQVHKHIGEVDLPCDLTVVVMDVQDRVIKLAKG